MKIVYTPKGHINASLQQDFYEAARASVQRLIHAANDIEGIAALFLFRHYMELTLKGLVSCARHLKTKEENMPAELVLPPTQRHDLRALWEEVKKQVPKSLVLEYGRSGIISSSIDASKSSTSWTHRASGCAISGRRNK